MEKKLSSTNETSEFTSGVFSYKLKISKEIVETIRSSNLFEKSPKRARAYKILDTLVDWTNSKLSYPCKSDLVGFFRKSVCRNDATLKEIVTDLKTLGILCVWTNKVNLWKKPVWEFQIDQNFHKGTWYEFSEKDSEYLELLKIEAKNTNRRKQIWNDGFIKIDENVLQEIKDSGKHGKFVEVMESRNEGELEPSEVVTARHGRLFGIYSNLPREARQYLYDGYTGKRLLEIDNKASQASFLLNFLRNITKKTATEKLLLELDELEEIQETSSLHDFLSSEIFKNLADIDRESIKKLIFKFLFGQFTIHDKVLAFNKETLKEFENKNFEIETVWKAIVSIFRVQFSEVYRLLCGVCLKCKQQGTTLAAKMQNMESKWLKDILVHFRKVSQEDERFQYFTIHDAFFFSEKYQEQIVSIISSVNDKWFSEKGLKLRFSIKKPSVLPSAFFCTDKGDNVYLLEDNTREEDKGRDINIYIPNSYPCITRQKPTKIGVRKDGRYTLSVQNKTYCSKTKETEEQFLERIKGILTEEQFKMIETGAKRQPKVILETTNEENIVEIKTEEIIMKEIDPTKLTEEEKIKILMKDPNYALRWVREHEAEFLEEYLKKECA